MEPPAVFLLIGQMAQNSANLRALARLRASASAYRPSLGAKAEILSEAVAQKELLDARAASDLEAIAGQKYVPEVSADTNPKNAIRSSAKKHKAK